ncbi:MAG TPA: hypothetical protein VNP04_13710 [Alphaproteobacteria bacterium]|nr:hypothetical protein [Alphaproteobacteria bacterium]
MRKTSEQLAINNWLKRTNRAPIKESEIVKAIKKYIESLNPRPFIRKVHGGMFQSQLPDLVMMWCGTSWWFEVKRPGGDLTPIQRARVREIRATRNHAYAVHSAGEVRRIIQKHHPMIETYGDVHLCTPVTCPGVNPESAAEDLE